MSRPRRYFPEKQEFAKHTKAANAGKKKSKQAKDEKQAKSLRELLGEV